MPFFDYVCPHCKNKFSELVKDYKQQVNCPKCGTICERDYNGAISGGFGKQTKKCSGNCSNCSGCH